MTVPKGLRVNLLMTRFDLEVEVGPPLPGQIAPGAQQFAVAAGLMEGANAHARHHDEKERQEGGSAASKDSGKHARDWPSQKCEEEVGAVYPSMSILGIVDCSKAEPW